MSSKYRVSFRFGRATALAAPALLGFMIATTAASASPLQAAANPPSQGGASGGSLWHKVPYDATDADRAAADGQKAFNAGNFDLAIAAFSKAVEIRPRFGAGYYNLGYCFETVKDYDRAIAAFTRVLDTKPKLAAAFVELGRCYLAKGDVVAAKTNADIAIKLKPTDKDAVQLLKDIQTATSLGK